MENMYMKQLSDSLKCDTVIWFWYDEAFFTILENSGEEHLTIFNCTLKLLIL